MNIFKSQFANDLYNLLFQYIHTANGALLPLITNMIKADVQSFFNERDNNEFSLFDHSLLLPQLSQPHLFLVTHTGMMHALLQANINPIRAIIKKKNIIVLDAHLNIIAEAFNKNILERPALLWMLQQPDISGSTPIETAIQTNNMDLFNLFLNTVSRLLTPEEHIKFCHSTNLANENLLDWIQSHANLPMLIAYICYLENRMGRDLAFKILYYQAISQRDPMGIFCGGKPGIEELQQALAILRLADHPDNKWFVLEKILAQANKRVIASSIVQPALISHEAQLHTSNEETKAVPPFAYTNGFSRFRLFISLKLTRNEDEQKSEEIYNESYLPRGLLNI